MSKENDLEEKNTLDVNKMRNWYREQIAMAKLRTELAELMAREAKAGAERLHFLGSIASMQGHGNPNESKENQVENPENSQENSQDDITTAATDEAVVRSIN
jgi:hypothetical protein